MKTLQTMMKKSSSICVLALIAAVLAGCSTASYTPPQSYDKQISRQYNHSYQKSWDAVLDLVTAPGYRLDQISKDSGYISIARNLPADGDELDCGKVAGLLTKDVDETVATMAIRFKKLEDNRSEVRVIVNAERKVAGVDFLGIYQEKKVMCESTGRLESKILDYVSAYGG